ncbi:hypothetical protein NA57DRAFT_7877, partial [Rhizodiscina lignyota]
RRRKLAGYLKAANELRQTYQETAAQAWRERNEPNDYDDGTEVPGAFPDAAVVRSGDEQMIIFPSYARKHMRRKPKAVPGTIQQTPGTGRDARDSTGTGDAEYWKEQWEKYEDDHAIVDVDVRGWLYAPHKGQMNRKQRLFISLAKQLAGLPNQNSQTSSASSCVPSRSGSPRPPRSPREQLESRAARHENEQVAKEAENILRRGEAEADIAARGGYSERPGGGADGDTVTSSQGPSSISSPRKVSGTDPSPLKNVTSRASWNQPTEMTSTELAMANSHLMARLRPFLANPLANTAISAFFYNDDHSQQRTIYTDNNGHFSIRVALEFVPTHVRVLASEDLSVTEEVIVTDTRGVSLISDIDDTIKHSAIGSGAREIFRNAFIRELGDLTIEGVKEWYNKLAKMGVKFHYVSNSPWQLYPALTKFFSLAGLPPGSFHLKQYSGMLQGIFEPVAERKKSTLDKLAHDFPERSFILVGDSGEADLEVYTDFVLENPGRVLGVFIRDVTTRPSSSFFTSSRPPTSLRDLGEQEPQAAPPVSPRRLLPSRSLRSKKSERPQLPPRRSALAAPQMHKMDSPTEDLIDFSDDDKPTVKPPAPLKRVQSVPSPQPPPIARKPPTLSPIPSNKSPAPAPPRKPVGLQGGPSQERVNSVSPVQTNGHGGLKPPPPKPRRPSSSVRTQSPSPHNEDPQQNKPAEPSAQSSVTSTVGQKLSTAYYALPDVKSRLPGTTPATGNNAAAARKPPPPAPRSQSHAESKPPPPPPPRRGITSADIPLERTTTSNSMATLRPGPPSRGGSFRNEYWEQQPQMSKKEALWRQRWVQASQLMREKGVVLRSWKIGEDVEQEAVKLVEEALK